MNKNIPLSEKIIASIFKIAEEKKRFKTSDITKAVPGSRQYVAKILRQLTANDELIREGGGAYTTYALPKYSNYLSNTYKKRVKNINLKEHEVLDDIQNQTPLLSSLKENVQSIFTYAFLEMLNNAIEHSNTKYIDINIHRDKGELTFSIQDYGIGVFKNVMQKRKLHSELEAIQDLLKGKVTTQPRAHSGEGIFFTSRVADVFQLDSFGYRLRKDNQIGDIFIEDEVSGTRGTLVSFQISTNTKQHLNDVFKKYVTDPEDLAFDKTEVLIKLYTMGGIYISRSQARRVLVDLNKFKTVIMDFDRVPTIGQAFADEVFRVFAQKYPDISIKPINMNETVEFMVKRVQSAQPSLLD